MPSLSTLLFIAPVSVQAWSSQFSVAEVKPHFGCQEGAGAQHVRDYIQALTQDNVDVIALVQTEFKVPQPDGYAAVGAACKYKHVDVATILYKTSEFDAVEAFSGSSLGDVASMPYLGNGQSPWSGTSCLGNPAKVGERAYTGAVLKHKASGQQLCVIAATLPHGHEWTGADFQSERSRLCAGKPMLLMMDTNAFGDSMTDIGKWSVDGGWGTCSDPGAEGAPTCCNDIAKGAPYARYKYDRIAMCGGGWVDQWKVNPHFVCNANEEHLFTRALVNLPSQLLENPTNTVTNMTGARSKQDLIV